MQPYAALRHRLDAGQTVLLDGGMGAELVRCGVRWRGHGMSTDADAVQRLHEEFIQAGTDVIRTNTFQLSRRIYLNVFRNAEHMRHIGAPGLENRAAELTRRAVELARAARDRSSRPEVGIAGVMSPLEHCFRPDLAASGDNARGEHLEAAQLFAEAGVDLLLIESMNTLGEARIALEAARSTGRPVWVSFVLGPDGNVLNGDPLSHAAATVTDLGAEAVLVNCVPPDDVPAALDALAASGAGTFGAYPHLGKFDPPSWKSDFFPRFSGTDEWPPDRLSALARGWQASGARVLGGCCGARPEHVRALASELAAT